MSSANSTTMNSNELSRLSAQLLPHLLLEQSRRDPADALKWARAYRRFDGAPMVIPPALEAIYADRHPFVAVQKPAQVGVTEMNISLALWAAATNQGGRGTCLFLLPTQEGADRLSQRRLVKAFADSPPLAELLQAAPDRIRPTQRVQMRSVGRGVIYFYGSDQPSQYAGIDADIVFLDEFDLMNQDVLPNAIPRLRSSNLGWLRVTSTPTIPDFGVNGLLERSDERHYELPCSACGHWLEPEFPANVDFERQLVVCDCRAPLDPMGPGRWTPRRPEIRDIRGYVLGRLVLPNPPLDAMRLAASGTIGTSLEQFWRQDLGVPFISSDARLSAADLDACRVPSLPAGVSGKPSAVVMGVDVGGDHFWVVVRLFSKGRSYPLFVEKVYGDWEVLDDVARRFKVNFCAVDALPDTRGAKRFVKRMLDGSSQTYAFLVYYRQRGTEHDWTWGYDAKISAVRTLALDEMFDGFRRKRSFLPMNARDLAGGAYYEHMQALVRTTEPDDFGQPIPAYVHSRPDDFAHAENYVTLIATHLGRHNGWWD